MAEETKAPVIKYEARDGQTITLTFDTIKRYLVQGHPEFVTPQELMYFCGVCKSKGMNPFKKDCYLIKYTQKDSAAIVTAIDFLRSRAKAMPDCKGWKAGIILRRNGQLEYREGTLILDNEELVGGWFQGKPAGWDEPVRWTVPLKSYLKKTREGELTRFWQKESQPGQIAKVAETQGLKKCWPDEFEHIYTDAEISPDDAAKPLPQIPEETGKKEDVDPDALQEFDEAVPEKTDMEALKAYLNLAAEQSEMTVYEVKQAALEQWDDFWDSFGKWQKKRKAKGEPDAGKKKEDDEGKGPKEKKKGTFDPDSIIQKLTKYSDKALSSYVEKYADTIRKELSKEDQDRVKAIFERRALWYPLDKLPEGEPVEEPEEEGEGGSAGKQEAPPQESELLDDSARILKLADGAEIGDHLGGRAIFVNCPNEDPGGKRTVKWCNTNCRERKGCPTWEAYDREQDK